MEASLTQTIEPEQPDDELTDLALQPEGFSQLYRRYAVRVYRYLYNRLGNQADAEDVTAQVFLEAYRGLPEYHPRGRFASWLFTFASRRAVDHYRRAQPMTIMDEEKLFSKTPDPLTTIIEQELTSKLEQLIGRQTPADQEILRLHYAAGLTYAQIGHITGRSQVAIKMAMNRCLRRMRNDWEANHETE